MERKEPQASQEEYNRYVTRYTDVPAIELAPGSDAQIVSAERMTLSFVSAKPDAVVPVHRHEHEQMVIVIDGSIDFVIEGKHYHVDKGDVIVLPSNTEHGAYFTERAQVIDAFSPTRSDFVARMEEVKKSRKS